MQIVVKPDAIMKDLVGFQVRVLNYSDQPTRIKPHTFKAIGYPHNELATETIGAINPEVKITEMKQKIENRIASGEGWRTFLVVLGVVLIVGIIVVALAESSNNNSSSSNSSNSGSPRNSTTPSTSSFRAERNRPSSCAGETLQLTLNIAQNVSTGIFNSRYRQEMTVENMRYIQQLWETDALREVILQPNEQVEGMLFFPKKLLSYPRFKIFMPVVASQEHGFLYRKE